MNADTMIHNQRFRMVLFSAFPASKKKRASGRGIASATQSLTGMVSVNELPNRNHCSKKELEAFLDCVPYKDVSNKGVITYQYYYDPETKKKDNAKQEDANNTWLSFNSPLCSHSPFESHNSLEWRLNRTKRSPHP